MSEKEQIEELKEVVMNSPTLDKMLKAVDPFGIFGENATPTIVELGHSANLNVATRALEILRAVKEVF